MGSGMRSSTADLLPGALGPRPFPDAVARDAEVNGLKRRLRKQAMRHVGVGPDGIRTGPDPEAGDVAVDVEKDGDQRRDAAEPVKPGHERTTPRSAATSSKVLASPARTACFPVKVCQRVTNTTA